MVSALDSGLSGPRAQPLARVVTICQLSYMLTVGFHWLMRPSSVCICVFRKSVSN